MKLKNNGQSLITIGKHSIFPNDVADIDDIYKNSAVVKVLVKRGDLIDLGKGESEGKKTLKTSSRGKKPKDDKEEIPNEDSETNGSDINGSDTQDNVNPDIVLK